MLTAEQRRLYAEQGYLLCAHAGSRNTSDRPRLALNMKW